MKPSLCSKSHCSKSNASCGSSSAFLPKRSMIDMEPLSSCSKVAICAYSPCRSISSVVMASSANTACSLLEYSDVNNYNQVFQSVFYHSFRSCFTWSEFHDTCSQAYRKWTVSDSELRLRSLSRRNKKRPLEASELPCS